jgi:uncharacterized protein involved in cysteine biosynthesis
VLASGLSFLLFVVTIPLNVIPLLGTFLFLSINGFLLAWGLHDSFLATKGMTLANQGQFMRSGFWKSYMSFGFTASLLQLVPFFNILFIYTNVVGAGMHDCQPATCRTAHLMSCHLSLMLLGTLSTM